MAASGDPQVVAAPVFVIGSIALGIQLTQVLGSNSLALGSPIAILLGCTGLFLLLSTWWAASAGQSFVACFAGTFGAFWIGYSILVLGVLHNWYLIPAGDVANTVVMFSVTFAAFFVFITLASFRLPIIYTLIFGLVVLALCLVAAAYSMTPVSTNVLKVAGYVIFVFAALGMSLSWTVMNLSLGGPVFPPLGRPLIKPPAS
jgi:hypothetical protein